MAPTTEYRIAESVRVVRAPDSPAVKLFIDGEEFRYVTTGEVKTSTEVGRPGTVTIQLMAKSVLVEDLMLANAELEPHTHDEDATS